MVRELSNSGYEMDFPSNLNSDDLAEEIPPSPLSQGGQKGNDYAYTGSFWDHCAVL